MLSSYMSFTLERASDLAVRVPQGAQLSTQTGPLLLHGHHWKKTERAATDCKSNFTNYKSLSKCAAVELLGLIYSR